MPRRPRLPHILEILAYDDGPYARDGDLPRFVGAIAAGAVLAFAANGTEVEALRWLLLLAFVPEVCRRMWLAMPRPLVLT